MAEPGGYLDVGEVGADPAKGAAGTGFTVSTQVLSGSPEQVYANAGFSCDTSDGGLTGFHGPDTSA